VAKQNKGFNENLRELGLAVFIVVLAVAIQARNPVFLSAMNLTAILTNTAILAVLAVGMMLVLVTRGIDLSVGAVIAFSGMVTALTVAKYPDLHPLLALLEGTAIGLAIGSVTGVLVARFEILPIIASLGIMNMVRGFTFVVSGGKWVSSYQMSDAFKRIGTGKLLGINNLVAVAVVVYLLAAYFIRLSRTGRRIYAVGSNPEAAEISGLPKAKLVFLAYAAMGALSGLAGVLWVAKFASAQGDTANGYEMQVIAACILGGVSISGGSGKISGLLLGTLLLGILNNALPLIDVSPFWQNAIQGFTILAAVLTNVYVKRNAVAAALRRRAI
jgi:rhamnose transport system permease protein